MFTTKVVIPLLFSLLSLCNFPKKGNFTRKFGILADVELFILFKTEDALSGGRSLKRQFLEVSFRRKLID
jgi:hypothetical protein